MTGVVQRVRWLGWILLSFTWLTIGHAALLEKYELGIQVLAANRGLAGVGEGGLLPGGTGRAFVGHGVENGFLGTTTVPQGTTLMIPARTGTMLPDALGQAIEAGHWEPVAANPRWRSLMEGSATHLPGAEIPNLLLRPAPDLWMLQNSIRVSTDTPLSTLLRPGMGYLDWAACRQSTGGF
ncbi:MAG: putative adhesin [Verrucomicrobiales bacterium]